MSRTPLSSFMTLLAALTLAVSFTACGEDDSERPAADDIPAEAVAVVGDRPIAQAEVRHRMAAAGSRNSQKTSPEQRRQQALSFLIQEAALEQEAQERGVKVTDAEVRQRVAQARKQFPNRKAFRRFLGGSSPEHLHFQLRLQLLSQRVSEAVEKDGGDPGKFLQEFQKRWAERTTCRNANAAPGCAAPADGE